MLFLENLMRALLIFNGLQSRHSQWALLGYHYHRDRLMRTTEARCSLRPWACGSARRVERAASGARGGALPGGRMGLADGRTTGRELPAARATGWARWWWKRVC